MSELAVQIYNAVHWIDGTWRNKDKRLAVVVVNEQDMLDIEEFLHQDQMFMFRNPQTGALRIAGIPAITSPHVARGEVIPVAYGDAWE